MPRKNKKSNARQTVHNRLSMLLPTKNKNSRRSKQKPRAKIIRIELTPKSTLAISLRKFSTAKQNRTKKHSQLVIPLRLLPTKEAAFTFHKRTKRTKKVNNLYARLQPQAVAYASIIIISLGGIGHFGWQLNQPLELKPVSASTIPAPLNVNDNSSGLSRSAPVKLVIPKIDLNANTIKVGLNKDKTIQVPPLHKPVTGWYKFGPTPGEIGPSVIVGHVDTHEGPSVFWRLRELAPGDKVSVKRADGSTVRFKVTKIVQVSKTRFPTKQVYGDIDHAGLRLVTCSGSFNSQSLQYTHNTVVFASKIK